VILGIDIGGSKVALALGDGEGRILGETRLGPPDPSPARALADILIEARGLLSGAGVAAPDAIGVSAPGPLDRRAGTLCGPPNLPTWRDAPVVGPLSEALGAPAYLENDANAAALAEWRFGAGRGARRLVYLTMSTGVGGGLVLDGRLYRGRGDLAGEIGHAPIEWDGALCACGLHGCLEAYVGGRAWTEHLRRVVSDETELARKAGGASGLRPEHVVAAARAGDARAKEELERFVGYLARGVVLAVVAYAPDVVVLGTIASAAGETLCFAPLREQVRARIWPAAWEDLRILPAALGARGPGLAGICAALEGLRGERETGRLGED
jgi:glucokinase